MFFYVQLSQDENIYILMSERQVLADSAHTPTFNCITRSNLWM